MNERDKENLHFLLNVDEETFRDWLSKSDNDDLEYALELVRMAKIEMVAKEIEKLDEVKDFSLAKSIIDKIKDKR